MIKRINNIKNVGTFRDFPNGGSIQFEQLTFIYGLNTKGKTTLSEIFSSLKENEPSLITNRKSIPTVESNQNIKISVQPISASNELQCVFNHDTWTQTNSSENLHIFGSDFIHKNLFTGLTIERQNKENFTRFVLGEQGVQLATQVAEDKRLLRQKRSASPSLLPPYLRDKQQEEHLSFLNTDPNSINLEENRRELADLEQRLSLEQQRLQRPAEILSIEDVEPFTIPAASMNELAEETNILLEREFHEISSVAIERLRVHIENNFDTTQNAEQWIREGLDTRKSNSPNCSFCGQSLENAADLLSAYQSFFNAAYREYMADISNRIENLDRQWQTLNFDSLNSIASKQALLQQYNQLVNTESFTRSIATLNQLIEGIDEPALNEQLRQINLQIIQSFQNKERKPHEKEEPIDFSSFIANHGAHIRSLTTISGVINDIRESIRLFKEPYRDLSQIRNRISELQSEIHSKKKAIARVEQDNACIDYQSGKQEITNIESRIATNEQALADNQNQYLDRFYERIDFHFKQFGSENFSLERGTDNRGHQPVYFLKVKFKEVEINDSNITKIFSESDKRALALSLFWAKMDFLSDEQKARAVIVLDDPVTSFDDNRILKSITRIKELLRDVCQVVVLTHYSHFIRNFIERGMNDDFTISFIEIAQNNSTSFLRRINSNLFTETTYERVFSKIQAFINRESEVDIRADLRPFLESLYLPHFYIKEFKAFSESDTPFGTLNEKIEAIFTDNNIKAKFHEFRTMLNPDSHLFTSSNEEDVRSFASEMMDYLYNFSHDN